MECKACGADTQIKLTAEMALHFPGLKDIDKPLVWVFPEVLVCPDCGVAVFAVPETELCTCDTAKGEAAAAERITALGSQVVPCLLLRQRPALR